MNIPKTFQIGGVTWKVVSPPLLPGTMGATYLQEATVQVLATLPKEVKEQVFCHELVHCILYGMGKHAEPHDETFVDGFATLLHQYLKTAKP